MRQKITCIILGALLAVGFYEGRRAWRTRYPDLYIQSGDDLHRLVVFRYHGERIAAYIPIIPQCLPAYTVQIHVWDQDLVEGPDHKSIYHYAYDHTPHSLPWSDPAFAIPPDTD